MIVVVGGDLMDIRRPRAFGPSGVLAALVLSNSDVSISETDSRRARKLALLSPFDPSAAAFLWIGIENLQTHKGKTHGSAIVHRPLNDQARPVWPGHGGRGSVGSAGWGGRCWLLRGAWRARMHVCALAQRAPCTRVAVELLG